MLGVKIVICEIYCLQNLKDVLEKKIPEKQKEVIEFRKAHGNTKVGEVSVDMVRSFSYYYN